MTYVFTCPLCKKTYQKDIKMSDYDTEKDKQFCETDKTKLERVFEPFSGSIQLSNGMYGTGSGGWNNLEKPDNVNVLAEPGDIVEEVNGVVFLLQTRNGYNNIVAYRVKPDDHFIVWTLYEYCILLHDKYGIDFVRAEGDKGKYKFLERDFTTKEVRKDKQEKERDVYYVSLKAAREALELKCQEYEFYYTQDLYIKTSDNKYFNKMFMMVKTAVEVALKKRLGALARKGVVRHNMSDDLYDFTMTATANIMSRYKKPKGYRIQYLLVTADYAALGVLHNERQKFWDKQISLESWDNYEYNIGDE